VVLLAAAVLLALAILMLFRLRMLALAHQMNMRFEERLAERARIAREALRDAFNHARARNIEAQLTYGNSQFLLRVRDNGTGIDPGVFDQSRRAGHWGLPGMRERAKEFGGKVKVWSESGLGTEVELSVPASIAYGNSSARPSF